MSSKNDPMAAINKRLTENNKHEVSVQYARVLEKIALNTNWYEHALKQGQNKTNKNKPNYNQTAVEELKFIRCRNLQELYKREGENYNQELESMGLKILKDFY